VRDYRDDIHIPFGRSECEYDLLFRRVRQGSGGERIRSSDGALFDQQYGPLYRFVFDDFVADSHSDGHRYGDTDTHSDCDTDCYSNGNADSDANSYPDCHSHGDSNAHGRANCYTDGDSNTDGYRYTDAYADRHSDTDSHAYCHCDADDHANCDCDRLGNCDSNSHTDRHSDTDSYSYGHTNRHADPDPDRDTHGDADADINANGRSDSDSDGRPIEHADGGTDKSVAAKQQQHGFLCFAERRRISRPRRWLRRHGSERERMVLDVDDWFIADADPTKGTLK
jgi:hypothetical protein